LVVTGTQMHTTKMMRRFISSDLRSVLEMIIRGILVLASK